MTGPDAPESQATESGLGEVVVETTAAQDADVRVVDAPDPLVSIVVVTYGTGPVVLDALAAVVEHSELAVEIVVVDNPADGRPSTRDLLRERTAGLRLVPAATNLGFGGGNALGVDVTTGEFVCFLNPDVIVAAGWLAPLVAALDDPAVGIAGPVLLNLDGSIQEAGRVVYADGWTGAIAGRDMLTGDEAQCFTRDVDYLSAACWVVRREEFLALGGFDERYHPAFFEDVDYALRVEAGGQRSRLVVDVPVVHHHGQGGAGRDFDPHAAWSEFRAAWGAALAGRAPRPETDAQARQERDRLAAARVAFVDRSGAGRARRRALDEAAARAVARPRERVSLFTASTAGLDVGRARRAGVEVVVGDVDALVAERAAELTERRDPASWGVALRRATASRWFVLAGLLALGGLVLRAIVLRSPAGALNADEAYVGIESFEVLDGDLPIVLGGTVYTFPFESYVFAPFVAVFGAHILPLKLLSTIFWLAAGLTVATIGGRLRGWRTGLLGAALAWVTPGAMLVISTTAYASYSSGMLVTVVAFLLALRVLDEERAPLPLVGWFGVAAGFGFWLHPMFLSTLAPMVVVVLWIRRRPAVWASVVGGGLVGCSPLLVWNVVHGFPTLEPPADVEGSYLDRLRTFGVDLLPRAFGLRDDRLGWDLAAAGPVLYACLLGVAGFGLITLARQGRGAGRFLLPVVLVAAFPIMAVFENLIYAADGRYGVITFPFVVLAAAVGLDRLLGHDARRAIVVAGGALVIWLGGFVLPGVATLLDRTDGPPNDPLAEVVERLDAAGVNRVAGSYWGVLPVDFAGDRRIVGAVTPGWPVRFPERQRVVEASPPESVAFVFRADGEAPDTLWLPADAYHREVIGGFVLYLPESAGAGGD